MWICKSIAKENYAYIHAAIQISDLLASCLFMFRHHVPPHDPSIGDGERKRASLCCMHKSNRRSKVVQSFIP
jgi:hypothetical protein